ncbi:MAG: T9SS C-terminal target domain-containing protein [Sphingobacteriales bacterium]|nr:MAG: T9SS C-terminal target domain-containing protein [Sphingobacteriales bacterium]
MMRSLISFFFVCTFLASQAQPCTPLGDQTSYGNNNVWIGYVYDAVNFTTYQGFVNQGNTTSPNFDQNFGGNAVNYNTNGCPTLTESFSVRYKLQKTFTNGSYDFTVGGDDGFRLSLDGGATWVINRWNDQGYNTVTYTAVLNGTYNLVLEYYENTGGNRVSFAVAATCLPTGDPTVYGTNDIWNGYVYDGTNFNDYKGYINRGVAGNPNFDESFGGADVLFATSDCAVQTESFSVRFRLQKTFAPGDYEFTVGGDDGYRLSLDGGATWVINRWFDQSYNLSIYTTTLSGAADIVLEYYESGGGNRVSLAVTPVCSGSGNPNTYGTSDVWRGYLYDGSNFDFYKGIIFRGTGGNPSFDENFGGDNTNFGTSDCPVQTETFSARFRLQKTFGSGSYSITVGGDDGYRFSLDGGATWIINNWGLHAYQTTSISIFLTGSYNMVLEYYESGGGNRVSFTIAGPTIPVLLQQFTGYPQNNNVALKWQTAQENNTSYFIVEKSLDGTVFNSITQVAASGNSVTTKNYQYTDAAITSTVIYYRLVTVDVDGKKSYSPVLKMQLQQSKPLSIYPTVVNGNNIYVSVKNSLPAAAISIYNQQGQLIQKQALGQLAANQTSQIVFNKTKFANGTYTVVLLSGSKTIHQQQIIIQ